MEYVQKDLSLMPTFRVGDVLPYAQRLDSSSPLGNIRIFTNRNFIVGEYLKRIFGTKIDITHRTNRYLDFDVLAVPGADLFMIHSKLNSAKPVDIFGDDYKDIPMEDLIPRTKEGRKELREDSVATRRIPWLCNDEHCEEPKECSGGKLYIFDDSIFTKAPVPMSW